MESLFANGMRETLIRSKVATVAYRFAPPKNYFSALSMHFCAGLPEIIR